MGYNFKKYIKENTSHAETSLCKPKVGLTRQSEIILKSLGYKLKHGNAPSFRHSNIRRFRLQERKANDTSE